MSSLSHNEGGRNILLKIYQRLTKLQSNKVLNYMTISNIFNGLQRLKVVQSF